MRRFPWLSEAHAKFLWGRCCGEPNPSVYAYSKISHQTEKGTSSSKVPKGREYGLVSRKMIHFTVAKDLRFASQLWSCVVVNKSSDLEWTWFLQYRIACHSQKRKRLFWKLVFAPDDSSILRLILIFSTVFVKPKWVAIRQRFDNQKTPYLFKG